MPAFYDLTTAATAILTRRRLAGRRAPNRTTEKAVLAGGCFWGMQDMFRRLGGVVSTRVGYTGSDNQIEDYLL
jgi:Peptide methionine sulfoxide reductase